MTTSELCDEVGTAEVRSLLVSSFACEESPGIIPSSSFDRRGSIVSTLAVPSALGLSDSTGVGRGVDDLGASMGSDVVEPEPRSPTFEDKSIYIDSGKYG